MSNIITIKNVRAFVDENGIAQINLEDAARGLGFTEMAASGNETIRWRTIKGYLNGFGFIATSCDSETFVPENIFYRLAMKAKNETAVRFQNLVANEIMPSVRKHGGYLTPQKVEEALLNPDVLIKLATTLKEERELRIAAEQSLAIAAPKAEAWTIAAEDEGLLLTAGEIAKTVALPGFKSSTVRDCLRELNLLCKEKNEVTADAQRKGYGRNILETVSAGYQTKTITTPKFRGKAMDMVVRHWKQKSGS